MIFKVFSIEFFSLLLSLSLLIFLSLFPSFLFFLLFSFHPLFISFFITLCRSWLLGSVPPLMSLLRCFKFYFYLLLGFLGVTLHNLVFSQWLARDCAQTLWTHKTFLKPLNLCMSWRGHQSSDSFHVCPNFIFLSAFLGLSVCAHTQKCVENIYIPYCSCHTSRVSLLYSWLVCKPTTRHNQDYKFRQASLQACLIHFSPSLLILLKTYQARAFILSSRPIPHPLAAKLQVFTDNPTLV